MIDLQFCNIPTAQEKSVAKTPGRRINTARKSGASRLIRNPSSSFLLIDPFFIKPPAATLQEFVRFHVRGNFISFTPGPSQAAAGSVDSYVLLPGPWSTELFLRN